MNRKKIVRSVRVGNRVLTVTAYDSVSPEDCMNILLRGTLHQKVTGEQRVDPIPRDVKDWIIRARVRE